MEATLFKVDVHPTIYSDGLFLHVQEGSPITVEGAPMVRTPYGSIVPGEGWSADKAEAHRRAADRVEQLGRLLMAQADRMRTGG